MTEICEHPADLTITKKIDSGAFGIVFQAVDQQGNVFAIKRIPQYATITKSARSYARKICREVAILTLLNENRCEYIVPLHRVYLSEDQHDVYLQMPFVDFNLHHVVHTRLMPPDEIKFVAFQLLAGVKHMHSQKIMHRDLTLKNILVDQWLNSFICDFGLARAKDTCEEEGTLDVVTLEYRSPELLFGFKHYDFRVDIWSIGCMICEMFLRHRAFPPDRRDIQHQVRKIIQLIGLPDIEVIRKYAGDNQGIVGFIETVISQLKSEGFLRTKPYEELSKKLSEANASDECIDLIIKMLQFDFQKRITAEEALNHPWFANDPEYNSNLGEDDDGNNNNSRHLSSPDNNNNDMVNSGNVGSGMMGQRQASTNSQQYFQRQKSTNSSDHMISKMEIVHSDFAGPCDFYDDGSNHQSVTPNPHNNNNNNNGSSYHHGGGMDEGIGKKSGSNNNNNSNNQQQQNSISNNTNAVNDDVALISKHSSDTIMMTKQPSSIPVNDDGAPPSAQQYQQQQQQQQQQYSNQNQDDNNKITDWKKSLDTVDMSLNDDGAVPTSNNTNNNANNNNNVTSFAAAAEDPALMNPMAYQPPEESNEIMRKLQKAKLSELKKFMVDMANSNTEKIFKLVEEAERKEKQRKSEGGGNNNNNTDNGLNALAVSQQGGDDDEDGVLKQETLCYTRRSLELVRGEYSTAPPSSAAATNNGGGGDQQMKMEQSRSASD